MMARVLPKDPELEVEAEAHHTWHITDWRRLKKKEHGPVFECGGAPWFVDFFLSLLIFASSRLSSNI
jgi:ubiquitin carboxyl-terminal hydrolase 7